MQYNVLITGALSAEAVEGLQAQKNLLVKYLPDCSKTQLFSQIESAHVLITRSETAITKELLHSAKQLKVVARAAVGVNNIDIDEATRLGILVINTPGKNTNSAAEMTFCLLLAMFRNLTQAHQKVKGGGWDRHSFLGLELKGKCLGLVGLGHVGHRVAKFAHGFDMEVYAYDPYISTNLFSRYDVQPCASLIDLAKRVDVLSVHTPLNSETRGLINADVINALKKGSFIVNAARGGIVAEADLLEALNQDHLAGVAIDTWETEPNAWEQLVSHPKVWCSPHIGASTKEAQMAIGSCVTQQVIKAIDGGVVDYPVNLPRLGASDDSIIKPYTVLAEKLGALAAQMVSRNPRKVEVLYRGDLAGLDQSFIRLGWMKGYMSCVVDSYISYVNAEDHFRRLGFDLLESQDPDFQSFRSAIKFVLHYENKASLSVGGIVLDQRYMRISLIDDFYFELEPNGVFLMVRNDDRPGVIGDLGSLLGKNGVNIDSFDLCRRNKGGEAMAVVKVDSQVPENLRQKILGLNHINDVHVVSL